MWFVIAATAAGVAHFLIGGLWYSPVLFSKPWMRGLGLTHQDIKESKISLTAALAASAIASLAQASTLVGLFLLVPLRPLEMAALGAGLSAAFGFTPMLRDRVWADRPWAVILIDAGYEIVAGAVAGLVVAVILAGGSS